MKRSLFFALTTFLLLPTTSVASDLAHISSYNLRGSIAVTSWKTMRDSRVVKQDLDYSCGAASVATILNEHYGLSVTEREVLEAMAIDDDVWASFEDMSNALTEFGFRGVGYAASFDQLTRLKMPVIVYTQHRRNDHFSVIRGVNSDTVWLADPSLGNRTYSRNQFLEMWETRESSELNGRILAIIPLSEEVERVNDFFTNYPRRQTAESVRQQIFRNLP